MNALIRKGVKIETDAKGGIVTETMGIVNAMDALELLCNGLLTIMASTTEHYEKQYVGAGKEDAMLKFREGMYDAVNIAVTNVLLAYAPDIENRKDLTAEALLKAENEILSALPEKDNTVAFPAKEE